MGLRQSVAKPGAGCGWGRRGCGGRNGAIGRQVSEARCELAQMAWV